MGELSRAQQRARLPRVIEKANSGALLSQTEVAVLLQISHTRAGQLERSALDKLGKGLTSATLAQLLLKHPPPEAPSL